MVLDRGDSVLGRPVDTVFGGLWEFYHILLTAFLKSIQASHCALELGICHVCKLIDANGIAKRVGEVLVVVRDEIKIVCEEINRISHIGCLHVCIRGKLTLDDTFKSRITAGDLLRVVDLACRKMISRQGEDS